MASSIPGQPQVPLPELVARFGRHSGAFQALEPHFLCWYAHPAAAVAYVEVFGAWVAAGPPLCAAEEELDVIRQFVAAAAAKKKQAVFFGLTPERAHEANFGVLPLGREPFFEMAQWQREDRALRTLRSQVRRAARMGLSVEAVGADALAAGTPLRQQLELLCARWEALHAMPPMGFVVALHPFAHLEERRLWVARRGDEPVGFASAAPYAGGKKWLIEDIIRIRDAPNGTAESLIDTAIAALREDGVHEVSLGMIPLSGVVPPGLRVVRKLTHGLFNFGGLEAFKSKMNPTRWETVTLSWSAPPQRIRLPARWRALVALLHAFARGSFIKFGTHTMLRGPRPVLMMMVGALLPWTVALASMPTKTWFPNAYVQHAWVSFDVVLWLLLITLLVRPRRLLRQALAIATSLDTVLTLAEILYFPEPKTSLGVMLRVLSVLAPMLATIVLWGSFHRLRVMQGNALPHRRTLRRIASI